MSASDATRAGNGSVPDRSATALLIVDVISDFCFEDAAPLLRRIMPVARRIGALKQRLRRAGVPAIYINDNFDRWRSDLPAVLRRCTLAGQPGSEVVKLLAPDERDYFIFKLRHSGFFGTALETVLSYLGARRLILTGVSSHQCVLFTANDAYVRDYELMIPADCITAPAATDHRLALRYFERVLGADIRAAEAIRPAALRGKPRLRKKT